MSLPNVRPPRDVRPAYMAGAVVLVVGLAIAAFLLNVPPLVIAIALLLVAGGIVWVVRWFNRKRAARRSE